MPALACTLSPSLPTNTPSFAQATVTTEVEPYTGTPLPFEALSLPAPPRFANYQFPEISTRQTTLSYTTDLNQLTNPTLLLELSPPQQAVLEQQGFVVVPEGNIAAQELLLITTDNILATTWTFLAAVREETERTFLLADLEALTQAMVQVSLEQFAQADGAEAKEAARQNVAFFAVGGRLLDANFGIPGVVQEVVEEELLLIGGRAGTFTSPLFQLPHDYNDYQPVAYYQNSADLTAYSQALTWFRGHAFSLPVGDVRLARLRARQIVWMVDGLTTSQNWTRWERLEVVLAFGDNRHPEDLNMREMAAIALAVYGDQPDLSNVAQLDTFIATVGATFPHQSLRWLGRSWSMAEAVFPALLFNQVGIYEGSAKAEPFTAVETAIGLIRGVPHSLDLPALLGSGAAFNHLVATQEAAYQNFDQEFARQQASFQAWSEQEWTATIAGSWLYALQPLLLLTSDPSYPQFMRKSAWADKQLSSWVGGWALSLTVPNEQGAVESETGYLNASLVGYVEPYPELYARLGAVVEQYAAGLAERGLLEQEMAGKVARFQLFLRMLQRMAEKELAGIRLTKNEQSIWLNFGDLVTEFAAHLPVTVPIYTNENVGQTLYLTVADGSTVYAIIPMEKKPTLTVGRPVFILSQSKTATPAEPAFWMNSYFRR